MRQSVSLIIRAERSYRRICASAHLSKNVAVIGCNNHAEIWDDERWQKLSESEITPENIASVMDELEF